MKEEEYPVQYISSDAASAKAQKSYLRYERARLIIIVAVAGLGGMYLSLKWNNINLLMGATLLLLVINLVISFIERSRSLSEVWYACRTVAESTKKTAWQFMMGADPYDLDQEDKQTEKEFISQLEEIRKENKNAHSAMAANPVDGKNITDRMIEIRKSDTNEKLDFYREYRLEDQKKWYRSKAAFNQGREAFWFYAGIVFQALALIIGILLIADSIVFNPIGLLMTLTAAAFAWSQLKRYKELAISYGYVADQLTDFGDLIKHVDSQENLAEFVHQVEEVISREHSFWRGELF